MKRVLIVNNNMHIGGVQKALLNLLNEIHGQYEVTVLLFCAGGELLTDIPKDVNVITSDPGFHYFGMTKDDVSNRKERIIRTALAGWTRLFGRGSVLRLVYPFQKRLQGYDVAVSYLHSGDPHMFYGGCNEFVLNCVEAKRKVSFLHCDFGKIGAATEYNAKIYERFDQIAACSGGCRDAFLTCMPQLRDRVLVVKNCQNYPEIHRMAQMEMVTLPTDKLNVVTVARFGREKGILRAIQAFAQLGEDAKNVNYYLIGNGTEYSAAADMISEYGLAQTVFLQGEMTNPYGYLKAADVLLIPSFSEAAPMVIGEAAVLGTPVLSTQTLSSDEMITRRGIGWVCENSVDGIRKGIKHLVAHSDEVREKSAFLHTLAFDNADAVEQFKKMIDHGGDRSGEKSDE